MKKSNITGIILNGFILVSSIIIVIGGMTAGAGEGQVGESMVGLGYLKAFTNQSNIFAAIASAVCLVFNIKNCVRKETAMPYWAVLLQYVSACAVGLTFLTVLLFLAPMQVAMGNSYFRFFKGDMFFFHFLNPFLAGAVFVWANRRYRFGRKENVIGLALTVYYSILYTVMVVFAGRWTDFYGFTLGGHYALAPVACIILYAATYLIGWVLIRIHNRKLAEN